MAVPYFFLEGACLALQQAFVEVETETFESFGCHSLEWIRNLSFAQAAVYCMQHKQSHSMASECFWTAYCVAAYEFTETEDSDGDMDPGTLGLFFEEFGTDACFVFLETIRDARDDWDDPDHHATSDTVTASMALAHEIGHRLGLEDDTELDGDIHLMAYGQREGPLFQESDLAAIRSRAFSEH